MNSAIYESEVYHVRLTPRPHRFRHRLFFMYLDLDELDDVFRGRWLWSTRRFNLACFRRADYLNPSVPSLRDAVLDRVESELGRRPAGAVRLLTHLRTWGYLFNPVSFYYCFRPDGELDAVVAEITNTPWRERHAYVLDARQETEVRRKFQKTFHVSPFFGMDQIYDWRLSVPGEQLAVHMTNVEDGRPVFHSGMQCRRRALSPARLAWMLLRYPFQTLRIHAAIYVQAALLYLKRTPFFAHPDTKQPISGTSTRHEL